MGGLLDNLPRDCTVRRRSIALWTAAAAPANEPRMPLIQHSRGPPPALGSASAGAESPASNARAREPGMKYSVTVTTIGLFFILGLTAGAGSAATIELARGPDGKALVGLKVEGDIVPGDALKLLGMYEYYSDGAASTIFLLSKR